MKTNFVAIPSRLGQWPLAPVNTPLALFLLAFFSLIFPLRHGAWAAPAETGNHPDKLTAVILEDAPPSFYRNRKTGEATGFVEELTEQVARRAGLTVTYKFASDWNAIREMIQNGEADLGPGISISPEREKSYSFSDPFDSFTVSLFIRSASGKTQLNKGDTVGLLRGSVAAEAPFGPGVQQIPYTSYQTGLFDLLAGRIDAFAGPTPVLWRLAMDTHIEDQITVLGNPVAEYKRAFGVKKGRTELTERLNQALAGFSASPEYQRLYTKWYGKPRPYFTLSKQNIYASLFLILLVTAMAFWRHQSLLGVTQRLHKSQMQLRATLEATADGILAVDSKGQVIHANKRFTELWRIPQALMDRRDDKALLEFVLDQLTRPDTFLHKVQTLYTSDSVDMDTLAFWDGRVFERYSFPMSMDGVQIGRVWSFRDITERKRAEDKVRDSEIAYRTLTENIPDIVYRVDLQNKGMRFFNDRIASITGYNKEELEQGCVCSLEAKIVEEDRQRVIDTIQQAIRDHSPFEVEYRFQHRTGAVLTFLERSVVICDPLGNPLYIDGVIRDITDRKENEEKFRQCDTKFRNLFESAQDGIFIIDLEGNFVDVNPSAYIRLGYTKEELLRLHITALDHPDFASLVPERMQQIRENGFVVFEASHQRKDGSLMPVEVNSRLIEYDGRQVFFSIIRDITERKKMEQALLNIQKLEATAFLAGGIAHDYNNLLTVILGNIELAGTAAAPGSPQAKALNQATKASLRAKALTQKFITFATGGAPVKAANSPEELIKDTVSITLSGSNIDCDFFFEPGLPMINIDPGQIGQALGNIITNAREAMPEGGGIGLTTKTLSGKQMTAETGLMSKNDLFIKIEIEDHGRGIAKKDLVHIFDPYFSSKERGVQKGVGLGLTIADSIVKKHGGHIQVESAVGKGTTVSIYLPALPRDERKATPPVVPIAPVTPTARERKSPRILFMDDEEMLRDIARELLESLGYDQVLMASHGEEVLKIYNQAEAEGRPIDLFLLDLTIKGGMGGTETVKRLLKMNPQVKAIVCSGYANAPILTNHTDYGFSGVLPKPFSCAELESAITKTLQLATAS